MKVIRKTDGKVIEVKEWRGSSDVIYSELDIDGSLARYTMMAHYDGEDFYDVYDDRKYHPEMWMPIPAIPQLNPEKQSI